MEERARAAAIEGEGVVVGVDDVVSAEEEDDEEVVELMTIQGWASRVAEATEAQIEPV